MSYTMTIKVPEKAAWFEQRRAQFSPEKLGDLFVTFLMEQTPEILEEETPRPISARVHALRGVIHLPEDFDEREFKSERLTSRFRARALRVSHRVVCTGEAAAKRSLESAAQRGHKGKGGAHVCIDGQ